MRPQLGRPDTSGTVPNEEHSVHNGSFSVSLYIRLQPVCQLITVSKLLVCFEERLLSQDLVGLQVRVRGFSQEKFAYGCEGNQN